jgi:hypothetical protein
VHDQKPAAAFRRLPFLSERESRRRFCKRVRQVGAELQTLTIFSQNLIYYHKT